MFKILSLCMAVSCVVLISPLLAKGKTGGACGPGIKQLDSKRCDTQQISPKSPMSNDAKKAWDQALKDSGLTEKDILNLIATKNVFQFRVNNSAHDMMMAHQIMGNCDTVLKTEKDSKVIQIVKSIKAFQQLILMITDSKNKDGAPQYPSYPDQKILDMDQIQKINTDFYNKGEAQIKELEKISLSARTAIFGAP